MTTKETIQLYYDRLNQKKDWEAMIADNMAFTGAKTKTIGKDAYVQATISFLQVVKSVQINNLITDGDKACAVTRYELASPKGNTASSDIAEIFVAKDGKIESSAIFFDTATFFEFMAKG
jgi:ketosteroid isomerase-like protein